MSRLKFQINQNWIPATWNFTCSQQCTPKNGNRLQWQTSSSFTYGLIAGGFITFQKVLQNCIGFEQITFQSSSWWLVFPLSSCYQFLQLWDLLLLLRFPKVFRFKNDMEERLPYPKAYRLIGLAISQHLHATFIFQAVWQR